MQSFRILIGSYIFKMNILMFYRQIWIKSSETQSENEEYDSYV